MYLVTLWWVAAQSISHWSDFMSSFFSSGCSRHRLSASWITSVSRWPQFSYHSPFTSPLPPLPPLPPLAWGKKQKSSESCLVVRERSLLADQGSHSLKHNDIQFFSFYLSVLIWWHLSSNLSSFLILNGLDSWQCAEDTVQYHIGWIRH